LALLELTHTLTFHFSFFLHLLLFSNVVCSNGTLIICSRYVLPNMSGSIRGCPWEFTTNLFLCRFHFGSVLL
jgi:hypothetical protein